MYTCSHKTGFKVQEDVQTQQINDPLDSSINFVDSYWPTL